MNGVITELNAGRTSSATVRWLPQIEYAGESAVTPAEQRASPRPGVVSHLRLAEEADASDSVTFRLNPPLQD
jgi:hypothetical protein